MVQRSIGAPVDPRRISHLYLETTDGWPPRLKAKDVYYCDPNDSTMIGKFDGDMRTVLKSV